MRWLYALSPTLFLGSCAALERMADTPLDPANPAGPSQADATVTGVATTLAASVPLYGGIAAAALLGGYAAWKGSRK